MESFRKVMVYKRNLFDKIKVVLFEYFFEKFLKRQIRVDFMPHKYLYFKTTEEINYWGECFNRFFSLKKDRIGSLKATREEIYEIETYEYYVGNVSRDINNFLRGKEILFPYLIKPRIEVLTKSISKFQIEEDLVVFRRFPIYVFNSKFKKGDSYIEKGFISTFLSPYSRLDYDGNYSPLKNEVLMVLKVPKGTNACYVEAISNRKEYELLIQKAQKIEIEKNIRVINNRIVLAKISA